MIKPWTLSAKQVSVKYGSRTALPPFDVTLFSGQSTALVGPSGSGKSSLLAVLGDLLNPSSGEVTLHDSSSASRSIRAHTSWVLQTTNAMGRRTVLDNVLLGSILDRRSDVARRRIALEVIGMVGLSDRANAPARTLSGGEAQRVSIARALVGERAFILADEPTGQLDAATTLQVLDTLFANPSVGLVIATHDKQVWERCDRTIRIEDLT